MSIPLLDLSAQHQALADEFDAALERVRATQRFIGGPEVEHFEQEAASFLGVADAVGCASGSDALLLALWALGIGPGDEVITTPFTFFATAGAVCRLGARPVFVDIEAESFNIDPTAIEAAITPQTRALIPVHLFGVPANLDAMNKLVAHRNIAIVEDAAQSIGASLNGRQTGSMGALGCFSFFPSKNLGAWGDGGLVSCQDPGLAEQVRRLRSHGSYPIKYVHTTIGCNSRLDALQAAILRVKLPHLPRWNQLRREKFKRYQELATEHRLDQRLRFQAVSSDANPVFHQCVVRAERRDQLLAHLKADGIGCAIYYPIPLHLQDCFASLGYQRGQLPVAEQACEEVLALPIFPELSETAQQRVMASIASFYGSN
ncbi:MAG: transcriptional regulator [Rickettsiales bacterium]|nr:transcriptional regulator [Rickettsiales bacterium]